jgi:hypothetical protein
MGGRGSRRWYRWNRRDTVEEHQAMDSRTWHHRGLLQPSARFWWDGVTVQVPPGSLHLSYHLLQELAEGVDVDELITLRWTPCHYGSQRSWLQCPGWECSRLVAKLYRGGRAFHCRHGLDLVYESQREAPTFRMLTKGIVNLLPVELLIGQEGGGPPSVALSTRPPALSLLASSGSVGPSLVDRPGQNGGGIAVESVGQ